MVKMKRKNIGIVVLIAVGFVIAGGVPGLLSFFEAEDVEGVTYYSHGIAGNSVEGGAPNDLLDAESYVTSWAGGLSEKIVIRPYWIAYEGGPVLVEILETWVIVKLEGAGDGVLINGVATTTWTSARYGVGGGIVPKDQWQPLPSIIVELRNPYVGGIIVELWCYHKWDVLLNSGDDKIAEDKANLLPGVGSITAQDDIVEEGENAYFTYRTGYSASTKEVDPTPSDGWTFSIYSLRTGAKVFTTALPDDSYGTATWRVPDGTFVTEGDNTHRAVLTNTLFDIDFDDTFVIGAGMREQIPELPTFEIIEGDAPYSPGESITVQIWADSNEITDSPIDGFWVNVFYETEGGGTTSFIINHRWYDATETTTGGTATVKFTFPEAGGVRMTASAQDDYNLNSGNSELAWDVYANGDGDDEEQVIDWAYMAIGIILIIGAILIYARKLLPMPYNLVIMIALLALAAYFIVTGLG